jgi:DNA invertase Pin-like site-specific DNA recombinase
LELSAEISASVPKYRQFLKVFAVLPMGLRKEIPMPDANFPVVEYLRMSTEHQQYSLDNQHAVILAYANIQRFSITKTYTDGARSGVVLKRRNGLRQLLQDVMSGQANFRAILVYDVSRWGRFQDTDEGAHYEFICKQAGIPVHYCAEPFANDGSVQNTLMKALKRSMAGEYSRELGVKVLAGLKRLVALGFKPGGLPGYGLRRMLVSIDGQPKQILASGERKSITTDRVVLIPGPKEELAIVREIYRLLLEERFTVHGIAAHLNKNGISYGNSLWTHHVVHQILSHPKYVGCNVFGRTTQKLGTPSMQVSCSEWVMRPKAFEPIVSSQVYEKAQQLLLNRTNNRTDAEVLEALRRLLHKHGRLSLSLIKNSTETPSPSTYRQRFGSLRCAYELIGYGKSTDFGPIDLRQRTQEIREQVMKDIQAACPEILTIIRRSGRWRPYLRMKNGRCISIIVGRTIRTDPWTWQVDPSRREWRRITLLILLNKSNASIREMRVFQGLPGSRRFWIREQNPWLRSGTSLTDLSGFVSSVEQLKGSSAKAFVLNS